MELFWTQITDAQPARPARTKAHGSAWGVSLLAYAVRAVWGIDLPETAELPGGKPYFPACPQLHFSVSHTRTAALVAVSAAPVGADVEQVRPLHPAMARRLSVVVYSRYDSVLRRKRESKKPGLMKQTRLNLVL